MADNSLELICPSYNNNPELWPTGMEPFRYEVLSPDQQEIVRKKRVITAREDQKYLGDHPEVNAIVALILRGVLSNRPKCIHEYMGEFMTRPKLAQEIAAYLQQEMNTVVDLEGPSDDEDQVEEQDEGYKRVSRVSFQVEKNTTTFFDEFHDSSGKENKQQERAASAPYGGQHADCSMHPDAMSRKNDSIITSSAFLDPGLDGQEGQETGTKLARSVSDYYMPNASDDVTTGSRRQSLEATFTMSDVEPITISSKQSIEDSKINVMNGSGGSSPREYHYSEQEKQTEDKTITAIQNKLERVCSDFRYINEEESGMFMHVAGVADRRRSVLPTREALAAAFGGSSRHLVSPPSDVGSRTASISNNMSAFQRSLQALMNNPTASFNSVRLAGDVSPMYVDSRRGSKETRPGSTPGSTPGSAPGSGPGSGVMSRAGSNNDITPVASIVREEDGNRSEQSSGHASLGSVSGRAADVRPSFVHSLGSVESSRVLRKVQILQNEVHPTSVTNYQRNSESSLRNSVSSFKSRLGSVAGMSTKSSVSSMRNPYSNSTSPTIPDIAQAVIGVNYEAIAADLEEASTILENDVYAAPLAAQSLQPLMSRRASVLPTPPVVFSRPWNARGNEPGTTRDDSREGDDIVVEYVDIERVHRNFSVATDRSFSTTSSENLMYNRTSPPAGARDDDYDDVDIPEIAQSIAMGGAALRRSIMVHPDGGAEKAKMRSSLAAGAAERARLRSIMAAGGLERERMRSSVAAGGVEKVRMRSSVADGGVEKVRMRSSVADGGVEKVRMRSSVADGAVEKERMRSVAGPRNLSMLGRD